MRQVWGVGFCAQGIYRPLDPVPILGPHGHFSGVHSTWFGSRALDRTLSLNELELKFLKGGYMRDYYRGYQGGY